MAKFVSIGREKVMIFVVVYVFALSVEIKSEFSKISMDEPRSKNGVTPAKKGGAAAKVTGAAKRGAAAKKKPGVSVVVKEEKLLEDPMPPVSMMPLSPKPSLVSIAPLLLAAKPLADISDEVKIGLATGVTAVGAVGGDGNEDSDNEEFQREFQKLESLIYVEKTRPYPQILSELEQIESENSAAIRLGITSKKKREIPTRLLIELQDAAKVSF